VNRALRTVPVPDSVVAFADKAPRDAAGPGGTVPDAAARARVAAALTRRPRLVVCDRWARVLVPPGSAAWTLGRTVLVRADRWTDGDAETARLVAHELVHVAQWGDRGVVGFLRRYLADYAKGRLQGSGHWDAYRAIPDEVEAYDLDAVAAPHLMAGD